KDHLCLACTMGKSTKKTHKPKSKDTNQEKLYLLHMDLCGPMRVEALMKRSISSSSWMITLDSLGRFFEKQKPTGPNFIDWYRQLRIVLSIEDKLHYLEQPIPPDPEAPEGQQVAPEVLKAHYAWIKGSKEIARLMLMTSRTGASLDYERFSLLYAGKKANYNMYSMGKTVNELHAMLKLHEQTLPKSNAPALNAIRAGKVQKGNKHKKSHSQKGAKGQNQGKGKFAPKPKILPPPKRENPAKDSIYHECGETGH
nr:hypothetical protein [Tanacetum cinerariifolium]